MSCRFFDASKPNSSSDVPLHLLLPQSSRRGSSLKLGWFFSDLERSWPSVRFRVSSIDLSILFFRARKSHPPSRSGFLVDQYQPFGASVRTPSTLSLSKMRLTDLPLLHSTRQSAQPSPVDPSRLVFSQSAVLSCSPRSDTLERLAS